MFRRMSMLRNWGGIVDVTPDRSPIIGKAPVRVAVEAGIRMGWERFIGENGVYDWRSELEFGFELVDRQSDRHVLPRLEHRRVLDLEHLRSLAGDGALQEQLLLGNLAKRASLRVSRQ